MSASALPLRVPQLEVRPLRPDEAGRVVAYFLGASPADMARMGVDPARLPDAAAWERQVQVTLRGPPKEVGAFYHAWCIDGVPVGFSSLKNLRVGEEAQMHLHMWSVAHRGQGHGAALFCLAALDAFDRFALRRLVCEPQASNPMPNRMLARIGFPLVRTYVGASSELSVTTTLNRYEIRADIATAYLARHAAPPSPRS